MARIEDSMPFLIGNEGGYAEPPMIDQPTNMGITLKDLQGFRGSGVVTAQDLRNLTKMEATEYYRHYYWDLMCLDKVTDQNIASVIFDTGVLHGPVVAVKYAQKVLTFLAFLIDVDGLMGKRTIAALNTAYRGLFIPRYESLVFASYEAIIAAHPEDEKYRDGWEARAARLLLLA